MTEADPVRAIADAVLYEGYLLWPYSRGALKNQRRWTFGGVYPADHCAQHPDDACVMRTQCLVEAAGEPQLDVRVRFLQVVRRRVFDGDRPVDELVAGGTRHLSWEEAVEREVAAPSGATVPIAIDAGRAVEPLGDGARIVRSWEAIEGSVAVAVQPAAAGVARVTVEIANTTPVRGLSRQQALERTLCSTHTVLRVLGGAFASLADVPVRLRAAARTCANVGTWPVLVGEPGDRSTVLSSPIILEDHPRVAPESPGDLFDGGEIDQLLTLSILSMTDRERAEMRAADPRAREILERTEALTPEQLMRLHGRMSDLRAVRRR